MDHAGSERPLLYQSVRFHGEETQLTLTPSGQLQWSGHTLLVEKEVLGFSVEGSKIKIRAIVEKGFGICCFGKSKGALLRKDFVFESLSEDSLQCWQQKLQQYIDDLGRPKRVFVFVNPFGGNRKALKIFLDYVKPLLEDANVEFILQETKYQLHAKEVAQSLDLSKYDGILCVSGDGVLVEVINGLLQREDWENAIKMPLGAVPAGTGNGMGKSLLHSAGEPCTPSNAVLAIIRGHKCSLDVATVMQGETRFFSILMLSWGLVADIDIESEKYRWMGSARIDFYALLRIFRLRKYNGSISFVPASGFEALGEPGIPNGKSMGNKSSEGSPFSGLQHGYLGPNVDVDDLGWRKIDGPFVSVWLHNVPWGGEHVMAAPDAKFSDGYLDLIIVKDCPRISLLALMTSMNDGSHVKSPNVLYLKVKAFILEPGSQTADENKEGIIDVDGEVLARGKGTYKCDQKTLMTYDKLQITVDQGLVTLFSPA